MDGILDPAQSALNGFNKELEKVTAEKTRQKLESGEDPMTILRSLMDSVGQKPATSEQIIKDVSSIANTKVAGDEKMGILSSLLAGKGLSRPAIEEPLGFSKALDIYKVEQQSKESSLKAPKEAIEMMDKLVSYAKSTGNIEFMKAVGIDTARSMDTAEGKALAAGEEVKARKKAELSAAREGVAQNFQNYIDMAKTISPAQPGLIGTKTNAMRLGIEGLTQSTAEGKLWKSMQDMTPSLLPQIRRIAGDVGNATAVEQEGAKRLLIDGTETPELKQLKIAALNDFISAGDKEDGSEVKKVLGGFLKDPLVKKTYGDFEKKYKFLTEISDDEKKMLRSDMIKAKQKGAVKFDQKRKVFLDKDGKEVKL